MRDAGMIPADFRRFSHPNLETMDLVGALAPGRREAVTSFDGFGLIAEVENAFRDSLGFQHVAATNSGTSALYAAYFAVGLEPGDEVIVPAYTFFATAMPLFRLGCVPVLADCGVNGNIDPADIERRITSRTKAIVVTHMWGIPCDMDRITAIARRHNLRLVEDASHAHGASLHGRVVGSFGDAAGWSLGAKKIVTGGQGGMIATQDHDLLQRALLLTRANDKSHDNAIDGTQYTPYAVTGVGMNMRMHPFSAAVLIPQLEGLADQILQRQESVDVFLEELGEDPRLSPPQVPLGAKSAWYALPMRFDASIAAMSRDEFVEALVDEGALDVDIPGSTRPLQDFPAFSGRPAAFPGAPQAPYEPGDHPESEAFQASIVKYPSWYGPRAKDFASVYARATRRVLSRAGVSTAKERISL